MATAQDIGSAGAGPEGGGRRRRRRKKKVVGADGEGKTLSNNRQAEASGSAARGDRGVESKRSDANRPVDTNRSGHANRSVDDKRPAEGDQRRRRKRRRNREREPSVVERVERAATNDTRAKEAPLDPEAPLGPQEIADLKRQLAFLRDYRKTLKLKLNAQEDLLLNGAREPDDRGICHHLLSKVDYATVQRALEKLPAGERPRLVGGVLDFKPELAFLLLYLESLKEAGHGDATRALEGALERIDYASVSEGQMRRVLDLVVELFSESRRASLLLGLLGNRSFRGAFDHSLSKLPTALAELVVPVRALQAVLLEGKPNPADDAMLVRGLELALKDGLAGIERRPLRTRARFVELVARKAPGLVEPHLGALQRLLSGFDAGAEERKQLELLMTRALLSAGGTERAERRVNELLRQFPNDGEVTELGRALKAPRFGGLALLRGGAQPPVEHLNEAVELTTQRPVWLRVARAEARDRLLTHSSEHQRLSAYGIARVVGQTDLGEQSTLALERRGEALLPNHAVLKRTESALDAALQVTRLARVLAAQGVTMPDLGARRFELLPGATVGSVTLLLVNTWGLSQVGVEAATAQLLRLARQWPGLPQKLAPRALERLSAAEDFDALERVLDELRWEP